MVCVWVCVCVCVHVFIDRNSSVAKRGVSNDRAATSYRNATSFVSFKNLRCNVNRLSSHSRLSVRVSPSDSVRQATVSERDEQTSVRHGPARTGSKRIILSCVNFSLFESSRLRLTEMLPLITLYEAFSLSH